MTYMPFISLVISIIALLISFISLYLTHLRKRSRLILTLVWTSSTYDAINKCSLIFHDTIISNSGEIDFVLFEIKLLFNKPNGNNIFYLPWQFEASDVIDIINERKNTLIIKKGETIFHRIYYKIDSASIEKLKNDLPIEAALLVYSGDSNGSYHCYQLKSTKFEISGPLVKIEFPEKKIFAALGKNHIIKNWGDLRPSPN